MMMQTMGDSPVQINQLAPFLLMDDLAEDSNLMLMILLNMMNGGMNTQVGFQDNFNLMMPLLLTDDCSDETDADKKKECEKKQKDLLVSLSTHHVIYPHFPFRRYSLPVKSIQN